MQARREVAILVAKVIQKNGAIELLPSGSSMYPLIQKGDLCRFIWCDPLRLSRGDIVLYRTSEGQLIAHRLYRLTVMDGRRHYLFKGDTNLDIDEPVAEQQLVGKLVWIKKKSLILNTSGAIVRLWSRLILFVPWLSLFLRFYLNRRNMEVKS